MGAAWESWRCMDNNLQKTPSKHHDKKHKNSKRQSIKGNDEILLKLDENHLTRNSDEILKTKSQDTPNSEEEIISLKSFKVIKIIGEGSYGKVYLVK